jgi:AcrR family transcriptional regulator
MKRYDPGVNERGPGRPRDAAIDARVLEEARRALAAAGYESLSVSAVAEAAGTTRQAVYRRWGSKADLATAAIASMSAAADRPATEDPFADLVEELQAFRRGITRPDGLSMIGTMLLSSADPALVALFRERIVVPRRRRILAILRRARERGLLADDADLPLAVSAFTGSWYAIALAGQAPPRDWPQRIAALIWRGCGGAPQG